MREKKEPHSLETNLKKSIVGRYYDERMPRHKSKVAGSQDDRDGDSSQARRRSTTSRPHERDRERDSVSQSRSGHSSKLMSSEETQEAIRTLFRQVKETTSFFAHFKKEYLQDVRDIEAYAGQTILDKLWERKIKQHESKSRPSKNRPKEDGVGLRSAFDDVSSQLWDSLNDTYEGARSNPSGQNDNLARKLDMAIKDIGRLLMIVRTCFQEMDSLIKELKLLKVVLELGGAGALSKDDRAHQRPKARGASHGHLRDSSPEREDAQYEEVGEGSGSDDNGEQDGQHVGNSGGRRESDVGGDEEGQGDHVGENWED